MNRRAFINLLSAGVVLAAVPAIALATPPDLLLTERLEWAVSRSGESALYWLFVAEAKHPETGKPYAYARLIDGMPDEKPEECVLDYLRKDAREAFRRAFA